MAISDWISLGYTELQAQYLESVKELNTRRYEDINDVGNLKAASEKLIETMKQYDLSNDRVSEIIDKLNELPHGCDINVF